MIKGIFRYKDLKIKYNVQIDYDSSILLSGYRLVCQYKRSKYSWFLNTIYLDLSNTDLEKICQEKIPDYKINEVEFLKYWNSQSEEYVKSIAEKALLEELTEENKQDALNNNLNELQIKFNSRE